MKKIKIYAAVTFTMAVLICTAMLPQWTAQVQDRQRMEHSGQRRMDSVTLDIQEQISMMGKLSLVRHHDSAIRISPYEASMTEEEAKDAFGQALLDYVRSGLIPSFPWEEFICIPYLFQDPASPQHYAIFWYCYHESKLPTGDYIHLYLDDATGCVTTIEYYNYDHKAYSTDQIGPQLDLLCWSYFDPLGITDYTDHQVEFLSRPYSEYEGIDESVRIRAYVFDDREYGEVRVEFVLFEGGFYTMFPDV